MWVDREHEPPGDCPDGKTIARYCDRVLEVLMRNAWVRAATGKPEAQPPLEMLRAVTGLTWDEIERMSDASGNGSHTIAELKAQHSANTEK